MQEVPIVDEEGKDSTCGKATKDTARGEAGAPCKEESIGKEKEIEESGGERGGVRG